MKKINFPKFTGKRCLMMPYIQGDPKSVPAEFASGYEEIIESTFIKKGDIGFLTIDESIAKAGSPHRGRRSKTERAIHTEAGLHPDKIYAWGGGLGWGKSHRVTLNRNVEILIASNMKDTCALWDAVHPETSIDGDIGHESDKYPYSSAYTLDAGEVARIGILTPHESLPVTQDSERQFIRIVSSGVYGREPHFTVNPLVALAV